MSDSEQDNKPRLGYGTHDTPVGVDGGLRHALEDSSHGHALCRTPVDKWRQLAENLCAAWGQGWGFQSRDAGDKAVTWADIIHILGAGRNMKLSTNNCGENS
jgi:hypothetical protein